MVLTFACALLKVFQMAERSTKLKVGCKKAESCIFILRKGYTLRDKAEN